MASTLQHNNQPLPQFGWTHTKLLALPDDGNRYEIVDGELWLMPGPSVLHQLTLGRLFLKLSAYLDATGAGLCVHAPLDVPLSDTTVFQPDIVVAPVPMPDRLSPADAPRLLLTIECVSPSTAHRDRGIKRERYLRGGVAEYWIVDSDACEVERWTLGWPQPSVLRDDLIWWPPGASDAFRLHLPDLFDNLAEVAKKITPAIESLAG